MTAMYLPEGLVPADVLPGLLKRGVIVQPLQTLGLLGLGESLFERRQGLVDITTLGISDSDTHVAEPDVLSSNLLVQASCKDNTTLKLSPRPSRPRVCKGCTHVCLM
jgi:hypothetical protein